MNFLFPQCPDLLYFFHHCPGFLSEFAPVAAAPAVAFFPTCLLPETEDSKVLAYLELSAP